MEKEEANEIQLIWGHPYEGIYFDAPNVDEAGVIKPDGTITALSTTQLEVTGVEGKANAYKLSFTPDIRGDYIVYADMEAIEVEEEDIIWEDHVKAVIQYKATNAWDQSTGQIIEIIPLVRPYGLEEGFVFVGQAIYDGEPLAGAPVEIEKYYSVGNAPDPLPDWEAMVTRQATTDPNGVFSFTLDEPGVWVTAVSKIIPAEHDGEYDQDIRGILMIPVEETYPEEDDGSNGQSQDLTELESKIAALEQKENDLNKNLSDLDSKIAALEEGDDEEDDDDLGSLQNLVYAAFGVAVLGLLISLAAFARKK